MKKIITILTLLCSFGLKAGAQQFLSREAYRDKVEAYSQVLKQQRLKTMASTEARKIVNTGFLPQIDITAEGTANLNHLDKWNSPKGEYRPYTYQALATLAQPLYTGGSLIAQKRMAQADEELSQLTTELTLDQIHYQSDAVYWNASAAYASLEAAATFQDIIKKQHDIIQDRFNDGAISRTDLLMISTRQKEAELQYIKARQNYTLALQQLNILMGVAPNTPVDSLSEISIASEPVDILGLDDVLPRRAVHGITLAAELDVLARLFFRQRRHERRYHLRHGQQAHVPAAHYIVTERIVVPRHAAACEDNDRDAHGGKTSLRRAGCIRSAVQQTRQPVPEPADVQPDHDAHNEQHAHDKNKVSGLHQRQRNAQRDAGRGQDDDGRVKRRKSFFHAVPPLFSGAAAAARLIPPSKWAESWGCALSCGTKRRTPSRGYAF